MSRPVHLRRVWPLLAGKLARARHLLVFSDFDGTLCPIVSSPRRARLPRATRAALETLARSPRITLGVVSGRELKELRCLVGLDHICYVGSHGLEWALPNGRTGLQATQTERRTIGELANMIRLALAGTRGISMERKVASLAVHYRNASAGDARRALASVARIVHRYAPQVKVLKGKKVVELLPAEGGNKGATVRALWTHLRRSRLSCPGIYLGDDITDETVFARLGKKDLGVFVGKPLRTHSRFFVESPERVCEFLQRLCRIVT